MGIGVVGFGAGVGGILEFWGFRMVLGCRLCGLGFQGVGFPVYDLRC